MLDDGGAGELIGGLEDGGGVKLLAGGSDGVGGGRIKGADSAGGVGVEIGDCGCGDEAGGGNVIVVGG